MIIVSYPALIHRANSAQFIVSFPDLPGCISSGPTVAAAEASAKEALGQCVESLLAEGQYLPTPSHLRSMRSFPGSAVVRRTMVEALV